MKHKHVAHLRQDDLSLTGYYLSARRGYDGFQRLQSLLLQGPGALSEEEG